MFFGNAKEKDIMKYGEYEFIYKSGIWREKSIYSEAQNQTKDCFSYKWKKRETYESGTVNAQVANWLLERYENSLEALGGGINGPEYFNNVIVPDGSWFLDAGCGAGLSAMALFGEKLNRIKYLGADISEAVDVARERFQESGYRGEFVQADLNHLPIAKESLDVIFSEGVLHHTDSTEKSIVNLSGLLKKGGHFLFYVYAKKAPVREYTDDLIRDYFTGKSDEETWAGLMSLTRLGKALGDLDIELDVEEEIPYLGISAGKINLQRLFYWNICKAFYRPDYSLEEMNHVNFDWFRPENCHRQTPEEVKKWCDEAGLEVVIMKVEESGITVTAKKR